MIQDAKIPHDDINLAERVFGKSSGEIKGKTVKIENYNSTISLKFQKNEFKITKIWNLS